MPKPVATQTTTPVPTAKPALPASPCETVAPNPRLYAAETPAVAQGVTSKKVVSAVPAWALPLFGVIALFSLSAFVGVRARDRSTRQLRVVEPTWDTEDHDGESLLLDDAAAFQ